MIWSTYVYKYVRYKQFCIVRRSVLILAWVVVRMTTTILNVGSYTNNCRHIGKCLRKYFFVHFFPFRKGTYAPYSLDFSNFFL